MCNSSLLLTVFFLGTFLCLNAMAHPVFSSAREIRLLDLHPGPGAQDLSADIFVVSLNNLPPYDALSYAWDAEVGLKPQGLPLKKQIVCNGECLPISPNLGQALEYLRDRDNSRRLWIDKLCINQSDYSEREQQIRYMGTIFRSAQDVIAWLGDSDEDTATVWNLLRLLRLLRQFSPPQTYHLALGSKAERFELPTDDDIFCGRLTSSIPPELARVPPVNDPSWRAMKAFLDRLWFARLWTLQEIVVSSRCRVVCGEFTISWEDISAAAVALDAGGYGRFMGPGNASIMFRDSERTRWQSGHRTPLRDLLSLTRSLNLGTRYSHDKIFGLLSLVKDQTASRLNVQYARSLPDLFSEVARACILEDKSLAVLGEVDLRLNRASEMASWVPDWRERSPTSVILNAWSNGQRRFGCAESTEPMLRSSPSADTLILRGFLIAPITGVLTLRTHLNLKDVAIRERNLDAIRWAPKVWESIYRQAVTRSKIPVSVIRQPERMDLLSPLHDRGPYLELLPIEMLQIALRRTVIGDLFPRPGGRLPDSVIPYNFPAYAAWQQRRFNGPPPPQVLWEHDSMVNHTMFNRRAFLAGEDDDAFLGLGLKSLREGDWIAVLLGGDTPFVLRPMQDSKKGDASDVAEWTFVSECYVHGLMDGEAMERTREPGFKYKDFVLPAPKLTAKM